MGRGIYFLRLRSGHSTAAQNGCLAIASGALVSLAYGLNLALALSGGLPLWCLLGLLPLPLGVRASLMILHHANDLARLAPAIVQTIQALLGHGAFMALGLWLAA